MSESTEKPQATEITGQKNEAEGKKPRRPTGKPSTIEAIVQVMNENGAAKPMKVPAIIAAAVPLTGLKGKHPGQTVYSVIYSNAKKANALVQQVGKGEFKLTAAGKAAASSATPAPTKAAAKRAPRAKKEAVAA